MHVRYFFPNIRFGAYFKSKVELFYTAWSWKQPSVLLTFLHRHTEHRIRCAKQMKSSSGRSWGARLELGQRKAPRSPAAQPSAPSPAASLGKRLRAGEPRTHSHQSRSPGNARAGTGLCVQPCTRQPVISDRKASVLFAAKKFFKKAKSKQQS